MDSEEVLAVCGVCGQPIDSIVQDIPDEEAAAIKALANKAGVVAFHPTRTYVTPCGHDV